MPIKPRTNSLVKIEPEHKDWLENNEKDSPLLCEDVFIFLGEITNMPDHSIVAGQKTGRILSGYHTFNFIELSDDEM